MNAIVQYAVTDMERMARAFAASKLFGVQNPEQALALCLVAQAEGRHPASAAQDYHIISGRPAKKADAMLRDFLAGGGKVEWHALNDTIADATFSHPAGGSARIDWTLERAKKAQLTTPMWSKYPRQMLRSRVVSEGVRTVYPMATSGMYVPEEVQDFAPEPQARQEAPQQPVEPTAAVADMRDVTPPKRASAAQLKRDGEDARIKAEINACDLTGLVEWEAEFDQRTEHLPRSWLDPIRDMIALRREELLAGNLDEDDGDPPPVDWTARERAMDEEYAARVGDFPGDRAPVLAGVGGGA
jgi:hypothetical protein